MADTGNRTLRLLSLMQSRRKWARADLAGRLGVSVRTLRRDVQRLPDLGCPVEAQPGIDGGYRPAPGASLPPLVLDDDEAVALVVGLQAAAQTAVTGMAEASVRALTKVVQVLPVLSDIPLLGTALFSHNVLVYFAALLAVGLYFFLYRTRAGLDLRSVGENPKAADSLGIPV
ncbi:MAG TPA: HTH domain-containing protein, partial [Blastococcus sp.]